MLFRSKLSSATWDTWMYCAEGKYFLYYLITEYSPGEGIGVAVSRDGVHFEDYGKQIDASDRMVFYLGSGAVWESIPWNGKYLSNYSEWRMNGAEREQQIFFAESRDLIHWDKLDERYSLRIDPRHYNTREADAARWDCINPLRTADGYLGYWTARPHDRAGVGFGRSEDGLNWEALPPPEMDLTVFGGMEIESGSVMRSGNTLYTLIGCYGHEAGVVVMKADSAAGRFVPQEKSAYLFANQERVHAYFARFCQAPEGMLVNFHVLLREENGHGRPYTYLSPLKWVDIDEQGVLRLKWWKGNEALIGAPCECVKDACAADIDVEDASAVEMELEDGRVYTLRMHADASAELADERGSRVASIERALALPGKGKARVLLRDTMMEWYMDDWYMFSYTFPAAVVGLRAAGEIRLHRMTVT